jgi:hypothetical protein
LTINHAQPVLRDGWPSRVTAGIPEELLLTPKPLGPRNGDLAALTETDLH